MTIITPPPVPLNGTTMDRTHCMIPNQSYMIKFNHNIRHYSFRYAWHVHNLVYCGVLNDSLDLIKFSSCVFLNISISENSIAEKNTAFCSEFHVLPEDISFAP